MMCWRKGLGLLPALGLVVGCGGMAGPEAAVDTPEVRSAEAAAVTEACEPRTVYTETRLEPTYDTYVVREDAGTAFGTSLKLVSDGDPRQDTYLDFRYSGFEGFVRARLQLYAMDGSTNGPALYRASSGWTDTLTWSTRPDPIGGALGNVGEVASGSWVEYDVTSAVTGSGAHAFVLIPDGGNGLDFVSKEDPRGDLRPRLVLTYAHTVCTYQGTGGDVTEVWRKGGAGNEQVQALATDSTGAYVVAGVYSGAASLGGATFPGSSGLMLARFRADGTHEWSTAFPQSAATMNVTAVTLTPLGNVLVVGTYAGVPDFGNGPQPAANYGTFIAKFSPTGRIVWSRGFAARILRGEDVDPAPIGPMAVATDANGSLIVTGYFMGHTNLGGDNLYAGPSSTAYEDAYPGMFIAKYTWDGLHLWSRAYEAGSHGAMGAALATDSAGNVLLGGYASGNYNGPPVLGATGRENPVIAKFSPAGELLWNRTLTGAMGTVVGVAALPGDAVAFSGRFSKSFTFAGQTLESSEANEEPDGGNTDLMLGVVEAGGTDRWARRHGDDATENVTRMVLDAQGGFRLAGHHTSPVDLGGGPIGASLAPGLQVFVASYGPDGSHRWSRSMGQNLRYELSLGVTPDGSTLFGSTLSGTTHVGSAEYGPSDGADLFLLKLAP
ncbi:DNRLRE domain-containing protein [Pyxidicoccus sp. 3LG]